MSDGDDGNPVLIIAALGILVLGIAAWTGINIYLLATRSQSIGKYLMGMQVFDFETNQPATFMKCAVVRSFVNGLLTGIPGVGGLYALVDALFVFSEDHRCLHDRLAGTYVLKKI